MGCERHPLHFIEEWSHAIRIGLQPTVFPYPLNPNAYLAHKMALVTRISQGPLLQFFPSGISVTGVWASGTVLGQLSGGVPCALLCLGRTPCNCMTCSGCHVKPYCSWLALRYRACRSSCSTKGSSSAFEVYIVPPDQEFLSELGLPAAAESLAGSLLGLQARLRRK